MISKNNVEDVFRAELREQLEQYIAENWKADFQKNFGDYQPGPANRASKIYEVIAAEIIAKYHVSLSHDSLRRFVKNEAKSYASTLDGICKWIGYDSWKDFKTQNEDTVLLANEIEMEGRSGRRNWQAPAFLQRKFYEDERKGLIASVAGVIILALMALAYSFYRPSEAVAITSKVKFSVLHKSGKFTPATYFLGVDLTDYPYDSAYITFNHQADEKNITGDQEKIPVRKAVDTLEFIAYKPDIIFAQLTVDDEVVSVIRLTTYSEDWVGWYDSFLPEAMNLVGWIDPLALEEWYKQPGKLYFPRENIQNSKHRGYYFTHYKNVRDFDVDLSEAALTFNIRNKLENGGISCFSGAFTLYDDRGNVLHYSVSRKGCNLSNITFNNTIVPQSITEREKLTYDLTDWTDVTLQIKGKQASIYIAGNYQFKFTLPDEMGELKGIMVDFKGSGELNVVDIKDQKGNVYYEDFGKVLKE